MTIIEKISSPKYSLALFLISYVITKRFDNIYVDITCLSLLLLVAYFRFRYLIAQDKINKTATAKKAATYMGIILVVLVSFYFVSNNFLYKKPF